MIAYVILIAIAIGLAIGVFSWLKSYANVTPKIDCKPGTSIMLEDYNCTNDGTFTINIKNNGMFDINGIFMMYGNDSNKQPTKTTRAKDSLKSDLPGFYTGRINVSETKTITFYSDNCSTEIKIVQIQPFILDSKNKKILCEQGIIKEKIVAESGSSGGGISTDGLISWWKFDGNNQDSIGNNHGTYFGGGEDLSGNVLNLDGIEDYVEINNNLDFDDFNTGFTVVAWAKPVGWTGYYHTIVGQENGFLLTINETGYLHNWIHTTTTGWTMDNSNPLINLDKWTHFVLTYDGSKIKSYIDGNLQGSGTDKNGDMGTLNKTSIGKRIDTNQFFNGSIDNVMIYNRSLSSEEISLIYNDPETKKS